MITTACCSLLRLEQFRDFQLPDDETAAVAQYLDVCPTCRTALEALPASPCSAFQLALRLLREDDHTDNPAQVEALAERAMREAAQCPGIDETKLNLPTESATGVEQRSAHAQLGDL